MTFSALREFPEDNPYAVILSARAALKSREDQLNAWVIDERGGLPFQAPSEKTIADYRADVARLIKFDNPWIQAANTTKKLTWLKRKSALLSIAKMEITELLKAQDKMQRSGELKNNPENTAKWLEIIQRIHYFTSIIEAKPPEPIKDKPETHPLAVKTPRKSKRNNGKLPDDWRETLAKRMPTWRSQVLVCAVTGCRPAEIELGIRLAVNGGQLKAVVRGKKTGPYSGQEQRMLAWDLKDSGPLVLELADQVKKAGGSLLVNYAGHDGKNPAKTFSQAMTQAGKRCFPGNKVSLTPYSLRHAAASDAKASGLTAHEVSAVLGHQSLETQSTYGHGSRALRGGVAPARVKASTEVRGTVPEIPDIVSCRKKPPKQVKSSKKIGAITKR